MVYIGHFSFDSSDRKQANDWYGHFTCVVETDSAEKATEKLRRLLRELRTTTTVFDELENVELDSLIEIGFIPRNGFLAYFKEIHGKCLGTLSTELVGVAANKKVRAFHLVNEQLREDGSSSPQTFLIFESSPF